MSRSGPSAGADLIPLAGDRPGREIGRRVFLTPSSASTNADARAYVERVGSRAAHGVVFTTLDQHSGRGTRGRTWWAPPDAALPLSIVVAGEQPLPHPAAITVVAALAVCDSAAALGAEVAIRWPNDVVGRDSGKLCGILAEALATDPPAFVLGIGVNFRPSSSPPPSDLLQPVSDLVSSGATDGPRWSYALSLCAALEARIAEFRRNGVAAIAAGFNARSTLHGRPVTLQHGRTRIEGIFGHIDPSFRLVVTLGDGTTIALPCEQLELLRDAPDGGDAARADA